jgi:hypothetical protein
MRGYAKAASVGLLMMGLLATPNLSSAKDGDGKHHLLNADLRAKIERLRDRIEDHRERHHHNNQGEVPGSVLALQTEVANLKAALATANGQLSVLDSRLKTIEAGGGSGGTTSPVLTELAKYVTVNQGDMFGLKGPHVIFSGVNVHVQSGAGTTDEIDPVTGVIRAGGLTGLGNFIVGYNERQVTEARKGSHNLVVGSFHTFTSTGGAVFGRSNWILGQNATVLGGVDNRSRAFASSILGGNGNSVFSPETTFPTFP